MMNIILSIILLIGLFASQSWAVTNITNSTSFPYTLGTAGETYTLTEDISCATTCFKLSASNVTLNLNNRTMTFGALAAPGLLDPGFESWTDSTTPTNWIVIDGTATRIDTIQLDTYDAQLSATASVKSNTITLAANQTYNYYAFLKGSSADSYTVSVIDSSNGTTLASSTISADILSRAFAMAGGTINTTEHEYKPTEAKSVYLQIDCTGASTKRVVYADIKPAKSFGVVNASYYKSALTPDMVNTGWVAATNFTVKDGAITQGIAGHTKSAAIYMSNAPSGLYQNMTINLNGQNAAGIAVASAKSLTIDTVTINSGGNLFEFNRMHPPAPIDLITPEFQNITNEPVEVKYCTLNDHPEYGIRAAGYGYLATGSPSLKIHHNTIKGRAANTEPYAISIYGVKNVEINNNLISPNISRGGRGILLDAVANRDNYFDGTENVSIHDNTIENIQEKANTEYDRSGLEAAGIRVRDWGGVAPIIEHHKNLKIYANTISVQTSDAFSHAAYGVNITANSPTEDIEVYNNNITATYYGTSESDWVAGIALQHAGNPTGVISVHHNTITSDMYGIGADGNDGTGLVNVGLSYNDITASVAPLRIGMYVSEGTDDDIDIYCNKLNNTGTAGYPIYLNGTLTNFKVDNNLITNSNSGGFEVWADANESTDVLFYGNGTIDVTGGGSVGAAVSATNGAPGCYSTAGSGWVPPAVGKRWRNFKLAENP